MRGTLFTAWLASIGLVTWHSVAQYKRPPIPSELGATVVVYGTLSLFEGEAAAVAGYLGWGLVIAGVLNLVPRIANVPDPCTGAQGSPSTNAQGPALQTVRSETGTPVVSTSANP